MKCLRCKKRIGEEDIYCGYCGIHQEKYQKYLNRVSAKIHKDRDRAYEKRIRKIEFEVEQLKKDRIKEIDRIKNNRWEFIGTKSFSYNLTEGKININGSVYLFSDIKGAEITRQDSYRVVTTSTGKSKKHISLGGGLIGGALAGVPGAVIGGSVLGKTKSKGQSFSSSIPTCNHIGVNVNINGFVSEIVLLSGDVDQSSQICEKVFEIAQQIVDKLRYLSKTPVPKKYLKPEEEQSVIDIDNKIEESKIKLEDVKNDKPTYEIPKEYL